VPPDWLLWLLPVPLATGAAVAWASWSTRTRGLQDPVRSVQEYERFRAAMGTPLRPRNGRGEEPDAR
jgi:cytochrome c-type biogenesis protein CcmH/NrfF